MTWGFLFGIFLSVTWGDSSGMSTLGPSSSPCDSFFVLFVHSTFLLYFSVSIFYSKIVLLPLHEYWFLTFIYLVEFFFVIWVCHVLFVLFGSVSVSFTSFVLCQYILIYLFKLSVAFFLSFPPSIYWHVFFLLFFFFFRACGRSFCIFVCVPYGNSDFITVINFASA